MNPLLTPSLQGEHAKLRIYSTTTLFVAGLCSSALGVAILHGLNAKRLNRLPQEFTFFVLALLAQGLLFQWVLFSGGKRYLINNLSQLPLWWPQQLLGMVFFAYSYQRYRQTYRAMEVLGQASPSGIMVTIIAVFLGAAAIFPLTAVLAVLNRILGQ